MPIVQTAEFTAWTPQVGAQVKHVNGHYAGEVLGYGERWESDGFHFTVRVGMASHLVQSRVIVIEDIAERWLPV